ncbi:MAG: radical SAM protein [Bacteroidota bacterium]
MKKKLILINPVDYSGKNLALSPGNKYPPLGLGIIAALTPKHWDVEIIDENYSMFHYRPADLVGITSYTANINRAYRIASIFKKNNIHTVIGGIHATLLPDEALNYADTIVVGEAEEIWSRVICDFENNSVKRKYKGSYHSMVNLPVPRRDLFHKNYWHSAIQTSRGCPMSCDYCSVPKINGKRYRFRPSGEVLDEIESISQKSVFFVDDNLFGNNTSNRERAVDLFEGMIKRGIKKEWFTFASVNCADDEEVLKLAYRSGCKMLFIGIETEDIEALNCSGKYLNLSSAKQSYKPLLNKIHKHGIGIIGGIIYGFDTDTPQKLQNRTSFCARSHIDSYHLCTLTPFPGTKLFDRLKYEDRLLYDNFPSDWSKFSWNEIVIKLKSSSQEDLKKGIINAHKKLYNKTFLKWKYFRTLFSTKSFSAARWAYYTNKFIKESYK